MLPDFGPTAVLKVYPSKGASPLRVVADGSRSRDDHGVERYTFVWGDGVKTSQSTPRAAHVYKRAGVYTITLVVSDKNGSKSHVSTRINVVTPNVTPRVYYHETISAARAALALGHNKAGKTVHAFKHNGRITHHQHFAVAFALQTSKAELRNGHRVVCFYYVPLLPGQHIPSRAVVAIIVKW